NRIRLHARGVDRRDADLERTRLCVVDVVSGSSGLATPHPAAFALTPLDLVPDRARHRVPADRDDRARVDLARDVPEVDRDVGRALLNLRRQCGQVRRIPLDAMLDLVELALGVLDSVARVADARAFFDGHDAIA